MAQFHDHIASLFQALYQARSVRTIEKEGGRRAGAGKEKGEALSFLDRIHSRPQCYSFFGDHPLTESLEPANDHTSSQLISMSKLQRYSPD